MIAQDIFKNPQALGGEFCGGFNSRVHGQSQLGQYDRGDRMQGFWKAEDMILAGEIYFTVPFPHPPCHGHAFEYGATWVCNTCERNHLDKPWWNIRVQKDGNAWCCIGEDFQNLQESENYAFGDTRDAAIEAYGKLMNGLVAKEPS